MIELKKTVKIRDRLIRYGLTQNDYEEKFKLQNGLCQICGKANNKELVVDHNHRTNQTRGLLCNRCNLMLWGLEDRNWFKKAAEYLQEWEDKCEFMSVENMKTNVVLAV